MHMNIIHICVCVYVYICAYIILYKYIYICIYMCVCVCVYNVYIHVHIHILANFASICFSASASQAYILRAKERTKGVLEERREGRTSRKELQEHRKEGRKVKEGEGR